MLITALWIVWALGLLVQPFFSPIIGAWIAGGLFVYFGVLEGHGIYTSKEGDTWSEFNWLFYGGRPARLPFIIGFGIHTVIVFANLYYHSVVLRTVGYSVFVSGFLAWYVVHLAFRGKYG